MWSVQACINNFPRARYLHIPLAWHHPKQGIVRCFKRCFRSLVKVMKCFRSLIFDVLEILEYSSGWVSNGPGHGQSQRGYGGAVVGGVLGNEAKSLAALGMTHPITSPLVKISCHHILSAEVVWAYFCTTWAPSSTQAAHKRTIRVGLALGWLAHQIISTGKWLLSVS